MNTASATALTTQMHANVAAFNPPAFSLPALQLQLSSFPIFKCCSPSAFLPSSPPSAPSSPSAFQPAARQTQFSRSPKPSRSLHPSSFQPSSLPIPIFQLLAGETRRRRGPGQAPAWPRNSLPARLRSRATSGGLEG